MVTIAGSGMGAYTFENIDLDFSSYDIIFCDQNFDTELSNVIKGNFKVVKESVLENIDKNILYIVTGSPLFFSGALLILPTLKREKIPFKIIDNSSSLSYMLSYKGVSLMKTGILSLHGKSNIDLENFLTKEYSFVICDEFTPQHIKEATEYLCDDDITITLGEKFGYDAEQFSSTTLDAMIANPPAIPYSLLIKKKLYLSTYNLFRRQY